MKLIILLLLLGISSLFTINSVFGEEIPIKLELNRETAQKGDPIILETTVEKVIPNTNLIIMIFKDGVSEYRSNPLTSGSPMESNTQSTVLRFDTRPSGSYEIFAYYGIISTEERDGYYYVTESLGSNSVNLEYFSEYGSTTNFLYDEIMPDKFDIGTSWTTIQQNVPQERICEIDFCYGAMAWNEFVDSTRNGWVTTLIYYFDDNSISKELHKKYFEKRTDFVTGDIENIGNIVECKVNYEFSNFYTWKLKVHTFFF